MATTEMLDLRRTDLRSNVLENPYWLTSAEIAPAADDLAAVLFSFPITKLVSPGYGNGLILLHMMVFEVVTAFDGTAVITIGNSSIATDDITTGGDTTDSDPNMYFEDADIAEDAAGMNVVSGGVYYTALGLQGFTTNASITPADTTVLCIVAILTGGVITVGAGRLHVLISEVPAVR